MAYLLLVLSLLLGGCSLGLLRRLHASETAVGKVRCMAGRNDHWMMGFVQVLKQGIDRSLLLSAGPNGLADIPVAFCEHQDPYRTLADLVQHLLHGATATDFATVVQRVKGLYQLQDTLGLSPTDLGRCLSELLDRLAATTLAGQPIGRVEVVPRQALVNRRTMMPLNSGTHVRQPLGVVVFDREGNVLNKAKVLCA